MKLAFTCRPAESAWRRVTEAPADVASSVAVWPLGVIGIMRRKELFELIERQGGVGVVSTDNLLTELQSHTGVELSGLSWNDCKQRLQDLRRRKNVGGALNGLRESFCNRTKAG